MPEKHPSSASPEQPTSVASLVAQLTSFALRSDADFRRGESDAVAMSKASRRCVGLVYSDAAEREIPLYNEKKIAFLAERTNYEQRTKKPLPPNYFSIRLDTVTQISQLPASLHRYFDKESIQYYQDVDPGDLNVTHAIEYVIEPDIIGYDITRNMTYALRDGSDTLYYAGEAGQTNEYEHVDLPHESQTLVVNRAIQEEHIDNQAERFINHMLYDETTDALVNSPQEMSEFLQARDNAAIVAILGLINSLKTGKSAPDLFSDDLTEAYELQQEYDADE